MAADDKVWPVDFLADAGSFWTDEIGPDEWVIHGPRSLGDRSVSRNAAGVFVMDGREFPTLAGAVMGFVAES